MVTLQAFTRGKSFYLGQISLGKFTSGFIYPRLKGHTGHHWTLGGLTSRRVKFQLACSKFWRKNWKHARESNGSKRGFYSYFIAFHYFISKSKKSKSNFTAAHDFSKDSKTTKIPLESSSRIVEVGNRRQLSFMWSYVRNCQVYSCWSMQGLCPSTVSTERTIH